MIAGVILAAGDSSRMGFPKQLAEYKGKTILETVVDTVTNNLDETVVVLGHENDTITEKLDFKDSTILINENWEEGIVSSIRTALFYLSENKEIDSAMFFMADQPSVNNKIIEKLIKTKKKEDIDIGCASELAPSDWRVVKEQETGDAMDSGWKTWRGNVRTKCNSMQTQIDNAANMAAFIALFTYTKQGDGSYTRPLGEFPTKE